MTSAARSAAIAAALLVAAATLTGTSPAAGQTSPTPQTSPAQEQQQRLAESLRARSEGEVTISRDATTGAVTFIGTQAGTPLTSPTEAAGSPEAAAGRFVAEYGALFGATRVSDLQRERVNPRVDGGATIRYQQVSGGVPVLAGELAVQVNQQGDVLSALGELQPGLSVSTTANVAAADATATAVEATATAHGADAGALTASAAERWIYAPDLLGGPELPIDRLVWRFEVTGEGIDGPVREFVLIDAATGGVALQFSMVATAVKRRVCNFDNVPNADPFCTSPYTRTEGQDPTGITDVDRAYDYSGDTYDFYFDRFGRDSIDGAGMKVVSTVRYCPAGGCPFPPQGQWLGTQVIFGDGFAAADDVVGHEITHGITEHTSRLLYYYQSGAISESMSDVFGEFIDLTNGAGDDSAGQRWNLGEEGPNGTNRDMDNPENGGDPDRMTSSRYSPGPFDSGGVHTNSGVGNKAAYLITDGGTFNGRTVPGVGITKAARIYYEAQTTLLLSGSDYADLANALVQACTNVIGTDGITGADCNGVLLAVLAVEMNVTPPRAPTTSAPTGCGEGLVLSTLFSDDLEDPGSGRWTVGGRPETLRWSYPQNPNPNFPYDATYTTSGTTNFFAADTAAAVNTTIARSGDVVLPGGAALLFNHAYDTERNWDGGRVEYSTNRGNTWLDAGPLFSAGGYTGTVNGIGATPAFSGRSYGYGSSRLDLSSLAGQPFRFRFRFSTNATVGRTGWFIDDPRIISCREPEARPDAHLRLGTGEWFGDNVVNATGRNQTLSAIVGGGGTATFSVRIQNDGNITEPITLRGSATSDRFKVTYLAGSTDITAAVVNGTYRTAPIAPGAKTKINVEIKAKPVATLNSTVDVVVTATSTTFTTSKDAVKASVTRNR